MAKLISHVTKLISHAMIANLVIFFARTSLSADASEDDKTKPNDDLNTIKLEADALESDPAVSAIRLDYSATTPTLDTIIYKRKSFNEFHAQDSQQRLQFAP